ncbi:aspartate aminotransferase family protein [Marivibrio halodurans]|uniref:Aspartate aminotransferase family protein n=1 Tax=Marivibrio halodurans TaxID=2039722 RepID=A0A8J7S121_9PROT|nr:aspartate aminotransferase family protein [Marivibrio halodurans]MBP5858290.1 aspartate aminotransferase family protein [Marivibrio halodurans]
MSAPIDRPRSHLFYQTRQRRPLLDRGEGVYLYAEDGRRFLDASSGPMVANIGYSNPNVLDAMRRQMDKATFGYRLHFENEPAERLAAMTARRMPEGLDRIFFVSGGSEAVESCLKLARQWAVATGRDSRWKVISRFPSYHGSTLGALAVTGMDVMSRPFEPMMRQMPKIDAPTCYLDRDDLDDEARGLRYAEQLRDKILEEGPESVLAFIVEPIGGASTGALVPPESYLPRIREICDEFGILLILDEVMTGAGRTGRFLGGDHWPAARPDIVAMSKGFAAGYAPLGAMAAHRDLVEPVLDHGGFIHGYTYAGNPLACAAGAAVIEELERLDLIAAAERQGAKLKAELEGLMDRYPFIIDVRGRGLLLAFELGRDRESMAPLPVAMNGFTDLVEDAYARELIIYSRRTRGGLKGEHFMICPPLIVEDAHIGEIVEKLTGALDAFAARHKLPVAD